jgi:hypothetical protein
MEPVDVLGRIDCLEDAQCVDLAGQRNLNKDAVDLIVPVEFLNQRQQFISGRRFQQFVLFGVETELPRSFYLTGNVGLRCRIGSDDDDGETRRDSTGREGRNAFSHLCLHPVRYGSAGK